MRFVEIHLAHVCNRFLSGLCNVTARARWESCSAAVCAGRSESNYISTVRSVLAGETAGNEYVWCCRPSLFVCAFMDHARVGRLRRRHREPHWRGRDQVGSLSGTADQQLSVPRDDAPSLSCSLLTSSSAWLQSCRTPCSWCSSAALLLEDIITPFLNV